MGATKEQIAECERFGHIPDGCACFCDGQAAEIARLRNVIVTGGAMYRAERAVLGIPGGHDPDQVVTREDLVLLAGHWLDQHVPRASQKIESELVELLEKARAL